MLSKIVNLLAEAVAKTNGKVLFYVNFEKLFELAQNLDDKNISAGGSNQISNTKENFLKKLFS